MSQKSKSQNSKKKEGIGKFLMDFFMFSSFLNGIMCNLDYSLSNDLKILTDKRTDDAKQVYQVFCQTENPTTQDGNQLNYHNADKALNCKFAKNVERDNISFRQRTFKLGHRIGQRKRLQFALLPIMYKMGVMTTLLTGLTILAFKGLTIGVILLIFAFGNHFVKYHKHAPELPHPIHVHVHSQDGGVKYHSYESDFNPEWTSRIDMNHQSLRPYVQNNGENTARFLLNQTNKFKTYKFYH